MARCDQCGAEGLRWETMHPTRGFQLAEPEGGWHVCRSEDKLKEYTRKIQELKAQKEAVQKYRDQTGYL